MLLAGLLFSATAGAQVNFTGISASKDFGTHAIGSPSAASRMTFLVSPGTTVGSIAVLTSGSANLDFANAAGSTCVAEKYTAAISCVVNVTFTPQAAGLRMGAVVFFSGSNNAGTVLGTVSVYGVGTGPQVAYGPGKVSVITAPIYHKNLQSPTSIAVDTAGDMFILDADNDPPSYRLVKVPAGGGAATAIDATVNGEALYLPSAVAVDGAGNVYVGDFGNRVVEVPVGGGAATAVYPTVNGIPLNYPSGLVVDGAGDLFIGDYLNNRVVELPSGGAAAIAIDPTVNGVTLDDPHGLAVDGAGDLFIADLGNNRVVMVPAGRVAATAIEPTVNGTTLRNPAGVAVNGAGDLFVADNVNHRVVEVPAGGGAAFVIYPTSSVTDVGEVYDVAADAVGNLFVVQARLGGGNKTVEEIQHSQPPTFEFSTTTNVGFSDTKDGTQTVQIFNIGNEPLTLNALSYPVDFSEPSGDLNSCTGLTSLNVGQQCDISVVFTPQKSGALNESVTLTDNAMNATGAQQSIKVSGSAKELAVMTSPASGSTFGGPDATFTWTAGYGVAQYGLWLGTNGPGSSDMFHTGSTSATSATVTGMPTKGVTVYARLYSTIYRVTQYYDYVYTEAASVPAALTSPVPGSTLGISSVMFSWSAGTFVTQYELLLGASGEGSYNLYNSGWTTANSATVTRLPAKGAKVYARLYSKGSGGTQYIDCTYTEQ
jgi:large repetitive protein